MSTKPRSKTTKPKLPPIVYAEVSVRSVGGQSPFERADLVTSDNVHNYYSESQLTNSAIDKLRVEGFEVLGTGDTTITIAGPAKLYESVFKTKIVAVEREAIKEFGVKTTATFLECPDTAVPGLIDTSKSLLADVIEGVALNEPYYYHANAFPPIVDYWHLDVPADISLGMNADRAHRNGWTGRGVKVVMVDSGWYRHPFFTSRGYRASNVILGPATANPTHDEVGHGTGESANIFSVAPDVNFTMVKLNFVNTVGGFNAAVNLNPDIISCSWGASIPNLPLSASSQALAAAIASAVRKGITVVFSAGNGAWGFPGQHPDVISAGGAFMHPDGSIEATEYTSGFASRIYQGRTVPDVCGLVGFPPRAIYIMLPVEPKDSIDVDLAGGSHPNKDETKADDGWAAFSGTSAAAPQIAGICALMKQACPKLTPAQLRDILNKSARDVTKGHCSHFTGHHAAVPGHDLATGYGLADAFKATMMARLRCLLVKPFPTPLPKPPIAKPVPVTPTGEAAWIKDVDEDEIRAFEDMILDSWTD